MFHKSPASRRNRITKLRSATRDALIPGTSVEAILLYRRFRTCRLDAGRFYSADDMQLRARVCVLGSESKEKLFSGRFALGESIRINGIPYDVVGVLKPRPQEGTENSINRVVYIPFPTLSDFRDTHYIDMIWLEFQRL